MSPGYRAQLNQRGIALVIVLWLLAALAALAATFASGVRVETGVAVNMLTAARARALADGGIAYGIAKLLAQKANPDEGAWQVDGAVYDVAFAGAFAGATLGVSIAQETGKIDVNVAPDEFLANLLTQAGVEPQAIDAVLDAIADFRDADDFERPQGAEAASYEALGLPYAPKNRLFESIRELAAVPGVTAAVFRAMRPAITVHTGQPRIDPATAPRAALMALPAIVEAEVEALLAVRRENQYSEVKQALPELSGVGELIGQAAVPVYTVRAEARLDQGTAFIREAIVWIPSDGEDAYWILDWTQGGET